MRLIRVAVFIASMTVWGVAQSTPMTNQDVMELKKAGIGDEIVISRIRVGATRFSMETADMIALKSAGVSEAVIAEMLKPANQTGQLDLSKGAVVLAFETSISDPAAAGLPDATRTAVISVLKGADMFPAVGTPEQAKDKKALVEISAKLVDFAGGNVAKRMIIGLGTGRAHAGFDFVVKDAATGKVLWQKTVKETASFWSNSASSSAQRTELPEKVAKSFMEQLKKAKIPAQR